MANKRLKDFKKAEYNPRKITDQELSSLDKSIQEFGDLSGVVINERTNTIIAGHQRIKTFDSKKTKIVTEEHKDNLGTTAIGHIKVKNDDGEVFNVPLRMVDWDARREKLANIAANNQGGEFDNQKLGKLLAELEEDQFDIELTGFTDGEYQNLLRKSIDDDQKDKYVRKLSSPTYEVQGKKPSLSQIYDTTKSDELKEEIRAARLPKDVTNFLLSAAERHTEFRFDYAAEYYAHASKKVQRLMEDCAMVIVDHEKAVEHGYLKLTQEIMDMIKNGQ